MYFFQFDILAVEIAVETAVEARVQWGDLKDYTWEENHIYIYMSKSVYRYMCVQASVAT